MEIIIASEQEKQTAEEKPSLLILQLKLRKLLYVRPFDINAIESAGIKLCDAVIDNNDQQTASLQSKVDRYEKALREIEQSCDGTNPTHYTIWSIAYNALNKQ